MPSDARTLDEHPILFTPKLVHAIRNGTKTETRRIVKPQPPPSSAADFYGWHAPAQSRIWRPTGSVWAVRELDKKAANEGRRCPYGVIGDRLWVRTTWAAFEAGWWTGHTARCPEAKISQWPLWPIPPGPGPSGRLVGIAFRCDGERDAQNFEGKWRSSLHLPRWAARDFLIIDEIRLEPLHDIDDAGARAEGVKGGRAEFACLWDEINKQRAGWASNPWVWVVRFHLERADG